MLLAIRSQLNSECLKLFGVNFAMCTYQTSMSDMSAFQDSLLSLHPYTVSIPRPICELNRY